MAAFFEVFDRNNKRSVSMRNLKHAIRYDLLMKDEEFSDELVIRDGVQQKFVDYDGKI